MNIFTSNFANLKKIPMDIIPVSIARFSPKWYNGARMEKLALPKKLLWKAKQGKISSDEYTVEYIKMLEQTINPRALYDELTETFGNNDIVLLCFEKPGEFCHRRLLAEWINQKLCIEVKEL